MAFFIKVHPSTIAKRASWGIEGPLDYGYADNTDIIAYVNDLRAFHNDKPVKKLPADFSCSLWLPLTDGRRVNTWVHEGAPMRMGNYGRMIKSSKHRVMVACPDCGASVPAGRTHQHKCKGSK